MASRRMVGKSPRSWCPLSQSAQNRRAPLLSTREVAFVTRMERGHVRKNKLAPLRSWVRGLLFRRRRDRGETYCPVIIRACCFRDTRFLSTLLPGVNDQPSNASQRRFRNRTGRHSSAGRPGSRGMRIRRSSWSASARSESACARKSRSQLLGGTDRLHARPAGCHGLRRSFEVKGGTLHGSGRRPARNRTASRHRLRVE